MSKLPKPARRVASILLKKFGGDITYKRIISGIYNSSEGKISETITNTTIKGNVRNVNQREQNDLIKDNDKLLTIAAKDITFIPSTSDRVSIQNIEYQIIRINTLENDNQNIKYDIYLRL